MIKEIKKYYSDIDSSFEFYEMGNAEKFERTYKPFYELNDEAEAMYDDGDPMLNPYEVGKELFDKAKVLLVEYAWFIKSINCFSLCAAQIYPYEIGEILSAWNKNAKEQFPILCKKCKWDDYDGKIKVEVIWN